MQNTLAAKSRWLKFGRHRSIESGDGVQVGALRTDHAGWRPDAARAKLLYAAPAQRPGGSAAQVSDLEHLSSFE